MIDHVSWACSISCVRFAFQLLVFDVTLAKSGSDVFSGSMVLLFCMF